MYVNIYLHFYMNTMSKHLMWTLFLFIGKCGEQRNNLHWEKKVRVSINWGQEKQS